jgi:hypothetical protein
VQFQILLPGNIRNPAEVDHGRCHRTAGAKVGVAQVDSASGVVCFLQSGVGRGIQNYIGPIAVCGLEGGIDQRVHDLLQLQQPLRVIVDLLQRNTLPNQRPFDFTAEFFGEIQALGGQAIQVTDQVVLCVFQLQLHHLMELLIVLRKGPGNGQKEDHRRKNYQDHGHPVEHQFSLHAHALLFGKGIQCPQLL